MEQPSQRLRDPKVLGALGILIVAGLAVLLLRGEAPLPLPGGILAPESPPPDGHAEWSFRVVPAGAIGDVTNRQRRSMEEHEEGAAAVVAAVNDALILGEGEIGDLEGSVTPDAAEAIAASPLTLSDEIDEVVARRRDARIGMDVNGARRAVATSVVVARLTVDEERTRVRYETTLWMERVRAGWRVIAFDGSRRRA